MPASSQLDSYFNKIMSSEKGEEVRDAIILAAKNLQKISSNTSSLNGVPAEKFALSKDYLDYIVKIDGKPATEFEPAVVGVLTFDAIEDIQGDEGDAHFRESNNLINSGNLYAILNNYIRPSLAYVIHYENDPESGVEDSKKAVMEYIDSLYEAKSAITKALKSKGYFDYESQKYVSLKPDLCKDMREFAQLIHKIGTGTPDLVSGGTFSEQKEYDAGDGKAYTSFKVQCDDYFDNDTQFNENKTYTAEDGKLYPKTISVSVNTRSSVRSGVGGRTTGTGKDDLTSEGYMESVTFVENGTYTAMEDFGAPGWLSVTTDVSVPDVSGMVFTVNFMYDGVSYGSTQVEAYGVARFNDTYPVHEDPNYEFAGWEPAPVFVVSDMTCEAKFKPKQESSGEEIQDDWQTIVINRGADYKIGDYKTLTVGTIDGYNYGSMVFMKVAEGEDSTTSTWVTKTRHNVRSMYSGEAIQWPSSPLRNFLNGKFVEDLLNGNTNCQLIAQAALPVRKRTLSAIKGVDIHFAELESVDTFWVPSAREMIGMVDYSTVEEGRWKLYYNGQKLNGDYHYTWNYTGLVPNTYNYDSVADGQYIEGSGKSYANDFAFPVCTLSSSEEWGGSPSTLLRIRYNFIPSNIAGYGDSFNTRTYGVSYSYNASNPDYCRWEFNGNPQNWAIGNFKIGFCM